MKVDQTKRFLDNLLAATEMSSRVVDPFAVWAAFKLLLHQNVDDCEDEGIAYFVEWGFDNELHTSVYLHFVRVFSIFSGNVFSHSLETRCDLMTHRWPRNIDLASEVAPSNFTSIERSIFDIERRQAFRTLLRWEGPWTLEICHEQR